MIIRGKNKFLFVFIFSVIVIFVSLGLISACYCGDNIINQASEECDLGTSNGNLCWAEYGSSCTYCTTLCKLIIITNYCGDGILNSACEECDDGNLVNGDGCSDECKIEEPPEPVCDHEIAVRYSYSNSYGTGIAIGNESWIKGEPANLEKGNYKIKYFIDNEKEEKDNVSISVKLDDEILLEYYYLIDEYHSKEIDLDASELCGTHTISVEVESDGYECNLEDNYALREIYINCEEEPPIPTCGDGTCNGAETCSTCPGDCGNCPPIPTCGDGTCNGAETCSTCPGDCGECECEDECCECFETCFSCPIECTDYNFNYSDKGEKEKTIRLNHFVQFCDPNWVCTGWSECVNGVMTRECNDDNNCKDEYNKPYEESACTGKVLSDSSEYQRVNYFWFWIVLGIILFIILLWILINFL